MLKKKKKSPIFVSVVKVKYAEENLDGLCVSELLPLFAGCSSSSEL